MRILVVEDAEDVAWPIRVQLERDGHAVDCAASAASANDYLAVRGYDLVVLDLNLPDDSGTIILRSLRKCKSASRVLVLTARCGIDDRVGVLDLGADDYMTKPFDLRELAARVRALLRRTGEEPAGVPFEFGPLHFDPATARAWAHGVDLHLTRRELSLLKVFLSHPKRTLGKEELHAKLFNLEDDQGLNAVELYVGRLRKKLVGTGVSIRTRWGVGYEVFIDAC